MTEPDDLQLLRQAVIAQSRLIAEVMQMFRDGDLEMTPDEGHEMLLRSVERFDQDALLRGYLEPVHRAFPRRSTED